MARVCTAGLLCAAAAAAAPSAFNTGHLVRTQFGLVNRKCLLEVPSGTHISDVDGRAVATFANGSVVDFGTCSAEPRVSAQQRKSGAAGRNRAALPPDTEWPEHTWFGLSWADFTRPPFPDNAAIFSFNASWVVPPLPANTVGNRSAPWPYRPTLSYWIGIQGPTVLQPVLEFNGLLPGMYDAVSWNCCPGGFVWHAEPVPTFPGDTIVGAMVRTSEPQGKGRAGGTYATLTTVVPGPHRQQEVERALERLERAEARAEAEVDALAGIARSSLAPVIAERLRQMLQSGVEAEAGSIDDASGDAGSAKPTTPVAAGAGPLQSSVLVSDMDQEANWTANWAEVVVESYFVSNCDQLPCTSSGSEGTGSGRNGQALRGAVLSLPASSLTSTPGELFYNLSLLLVNTTAAGYDTVEGSGSGAAAGSAASRPSAAWDGMGEAHGNSASGQPSGAYSAPYAVQYVPWEQFYETEGATASAAAPLCSGTTSSNNGGEGAGTAIVFESCGA